MTKLPTDLVQALGTINAVFVDSKRQTNARYPNANAEVDLFPMGYAECGGDGWGGYADLGDGTHVDLGKDAGWRMKDAGRGRVRCERE
jgi:hypothetical protein